MKKALIAGTFDPITNGHIDLIKRACALFDEVVVLVVDNPDKKTMFTLSKRLAFVKESCGHFSGIIVDSSNGLVIDYAKENNIDAIVRGARNTRDFDYEYELAQIYNMTGGAEMVILPSYGKNAHVSSSMVRELIAHGKDASAFVPFKL